MRNNDIESKPIAKVNLQQEQHLEDCKKMRSNNSNEPTPPASVKPQQPADNVKIAIDEPTFVLLFNPWMTRMYLELFK